MSVASSRTIIPAGFELIDCPGCGGGKWTLARTGRDWALDPDRIIQIVRCDDCGLHYTNPRPKLSELGNYYSGEYAPYQRQRGEIERGGKWSTAIRTLVLQNAYGAPNLRPRGAKRLLAQVVSTIKPARHWGFAIAYRGAGKVLDFGCGNGTFLRRMRVLGWDCTGIDFGESAVDAVRQSGIRAIQGTLPHPELVGERFDLVAMRQSLEHLPDPRIVLGAIRDLLAVGGLLVIQVPHYDSWEIRYFQDAAMSLDLPRHLLHLERRTLNDLLLRCGFEVVSIRQVCRASRLRKSLAQRDRRGTRRADWLLRFKPICGLAASLAERRGLGNELIAFARKRPERGESS